MFNNRRIKNFISVLLLVLTLQKAGYGLILHNWLHAQKTTTSSFGKNGIGEVTSNCNCVDDFYTPFMEAEVVIVPTIPPVEIEFVALLKTPVPFFAEFFHSLRGPPHFIA